MSIVLLTSIMITTIVYSAFSTRLQISGEAIVRSDNDIRITNVKVLSQTNNAYETYNNKYTKDTTSMFVTLPSNSSITYEVEITDKANLGYIIESINEISNTNSNIDIDIGLNQYDLIGANSTKKFNINFTNTTNEEQMSTLVLNYKFLINNFVVTFDSNIFQANDGTISGITINFDKETSVLTLNGTTNSNAFALYSIYDLTFTVGEKYDFDITPISGSITGNGIVALVDDVSSPSSARLSPRNNGRRNIIPDLQGGFELVIDENGANNGTGLYLWIWCSTNYVYTFNNYKAKVKLKKIESKNVEYGSLYGDLPITTKQGYSFKGWNTKEDGSGEYITSTSKVNIIDNHTLYAIWEEN